MSGLIEDALDFTRGRFGVGIALELQSELPVVPILEQVIAEVQTVWPNPIIESHFTVSEPVRFDRKRLTQLFTNLLSNAMSHGKAGTPVAVWAQSSDGKFELSVSNAADPIPPDVLERLFEPFSRGGATDYRQGLGLGLYIACQIARSHGGTIDVVSTAAETRFTFTMPTGD